MLRSSFLLPILAVLLSCTCPDLRADVPAANRALQEGRVGEAASLLRPWLAQHPSDTEAHLLLCRVFYAQDMADRAIPECEAAASDAPNRSDIQLWLGRAYGMKAGSANPVLAFTLARKVRSAFELSLELDPANLAAMSDLGEFYVAAPPIVGGGSAKARNLAGRLLALNQPADVAESHRILAMLAEKEKDPKTAETEFRRAASSNLSSAWIDLGAFYARHGQPDQAATAVRTGVGFDRTRGGTLVDAASVLTEAGRNPEFAMELLREYLASSARSDAAPAFKVHLQLGDLLARSGNLASARREYALALALAPDFPPAQRPAPPPAQPANR